MFQPLADTSHPPAALTLLSECVIRQLSLSRASAQSKVQTLNCTLANRHPGRDPVLHTFAGSPSRWAGPRRCRQVRGLHSLIKSFNQTVLKAPGYIKASFGRRAGPDHLSSWFEHSLARSRLWPGTTFNPPWLKMPGASHIIPAAHLWPGLLPRLRLLTSSD
ncbi:hypothetical protein RJ035_007350 [Blastomyces gilchristii]